MRWTLLLIVCVGCATEGSHQSPRWPDHRKHEEQRITDLEERVAKLESLAAAPRSPPPVTEKVTEAALDREMIASAVKPLLASLVACGDKSSVKGMVRTSVKVDPDGHVTSVNVVSSPDPVLGECVAGILKEATFPKTIAGGAFAYPLVF